MVPKEINSGKEVGNELEVNKRSVILHPRLN